ncbi:hypothetical protein MASR1M60_28060 [Rhodocyclaceae bacterium]
MSDLQRLTTEYIDSEDRIRLTGQEGDGQTVVLWLTRRLLDRLIPHLTLWLERQHVDLPRAATLLEFAQQQAHGQLIPQAPIRTGNLPGQLVNAVDITPGKEQIRLAFKPVSGNPAGVHFEELPLRQWLAILHQTYLTAQWPVDSWPAWMAGAAVPAAGAPNLVWH